MNAAQPSGLPPICGITPPPSVRLCRARPAQQSCRRQPGEMSAGAAVKIETPSLSRRDVLKLSAAGTAAMAIPLQRGLSAASAFKAPPVLEPVHKDDVRSNVYGYVPADYVPPAGNQHYAGEPIRGSEYLGTDYYKISETNVQVQLIPGMWTKMWGYNGKVPGPTIRSYLQPDPDNPGKKISRRTVMQVTNNLP